MRLMVFYDLPVVTPAEKRAHAQFRSFLRKDGYDMLQYSIYARICSGQDDINKHLARLAGHLPMKGSVRAMQVTEKQFSEIRVLVGARKRKESSQFTQQLAFF